jgi:DNA-binding PadR family transcriptional regulator
MSRRKADSLTLPDLVLLSLLSERPMHGYQANAELERRDIRNWAAVSRPQVYYSMEKLARLGMIAASESAEPSAGPERRVYATTKQGRAALAAALEREEWATQRDKPAFATWLALSWQAQPETLARQVARRRAFLEAEVARELATLRDVRREVGHRYHEAVWMIELMIRQFQTELRWLDKLSKELPRRDRARKPAYAPADH